VLKTIESFAVECSINKVWTSEALAYVVDEAVQVFGGNGYSREFPVERAYRDARITRIYEGTNEINRLIIPARLLKRVARGAGEAAAEPADPASEHDLLANARRLAVSALDQVAQTYGASVRDEQEILGCIADIVIECYAVESAMARAATLRRAGSGRADVASDVARAYASDAADRIARAAKPIVHALAGRSHRAGAIAALAKQVAAYPGVDGVAARRRIGDAAIAAGRYPF
jgi:hypothetical protein